MTTLDDDLGPVVVDVLASVGVSAVYIVESAAARPADIDADLSRVRYTVTVSPPQFEESVGSGVISRNGSTLIAGYGLAFVPAPDHQVIVGGKTYRVTGVKPIKSGDAVAAYKLALSR